MTDITELAQSLKRRAASANEFGESLYVKADDIIALVEALEKVQQHIAELERGQETLLPVGVMSEKAFRRLENSEARIIALWPRPGIYFPRKLPEDGVIVYARTAVAAPQEVR
jgi:hypothetical protein